MTGIDRPHPPILMKHDVIALARRPNLRIFAHSNSLFRRFGSGGKQFVGPSLHTVEIAPLVQ